MTKFKAFCRSFHKNVIVKRKYRAFWTLLIDRHYRADLDRLFELTKDCTKREQRELEVKDLVHGHRVVYEAYALELMRSKDSIPMIRVVFDPVSHKYVVVDGNHRLPAIKTRAMAGETKVVCEVIS